MTADQERRVYAHRSLMLCGDWVASNQWVASKALDFPDEWLAGARDVDGIDAELQRYLTVARAATEVARFGPAFDVIEDETWSYQSLLGHEPAQLNADVREFFEPLTPGAEWRVTSDDLFKDGVEVSKGPIIVRVHPEDGVLVIVAGAHPDLAAKAVAA